jgi:hypothetical protein
VSTDELFPIKNRRGWFRVSHRLVTKTIEGDTEAQATWNALFSRMVVVRAEYTFGDGDLRYQGYHRDFCVVEEYFEAPEYIAEITRHTDEAHTVSFVVAWRKVRP